ncbi:Spy/CpxP family protein refolding chaperone [Bacteroidota bacterium]
MNKSNKILVYAVIFLAILNITTFVTIGYHIYESKKGDEINEKTEIEGNTKGYSGRYFRDRLGLNPAQMDSFRIINSKFRTNAREITFNLISLRKEMLEEMKKPASDNSILMMYSDSIGSLHAELKKHTAKYYNEISGICTQEQQEELYLIFQEFFINDLRMGNPDNQKQFRRRQGFNNNNTNN